MAFKIVRNDIMRALHTDDRVTCRDLSVACYGRVWRTFVSREYYHLLMDIMNISLRKAAFADAHD